MEVDKIICGDSLEVMKDMPAGSIHCVVTSPPYWGLRDYSVDGQLGLEKTPEEYIEKMAAVFAEVKRVLRDDGTLWLNMGDSYWGGKGKSSQAWSTENLNRETLQRQEHQICGMGETRPSDGKHDVIKPKDLCGIPWMLAFALRADGWYLRSDIIWAKPNPMPESVTDRPTKSHEYLFLLTKNKKYYYDADAIREDAKDAESYSGRKFRGPKAILEARARPGSSQTIDKGCPADGKTYAKVNKRTVWTIPTQSCTEAHFATFPEKLVEPCIKAGTSEKGCCPECGAPWIRIVKKSGGTTGESWHDHENDIGIGANQTRNGVPLATFKGQKEKENPYTVQTIGWEPSCDCGGDPPIPCTVLDLFGGAGTTGLVAYKLRRHYILIELSQDYVEIATKRIKKEKDKYGLIE